MLLNKFFLFSDLEDSYEFGLKLFGRCLIRLKIFVVLSLNIKNFLFVFGVEIIL